MLDRNVRGEMKFKPDMRVGLLSLIGVAGFIAGCLILFPRDIFSPDGRKTAFHEIRYKPRELAEKVLRIPVDSLGRLQIQRKTRLVVLSDDTIIRDRSEKEKLEKKIKDSILTDDAIIKILTEYSAGTNDVSDYDTSSFGKLNQALHFDITPATIDKWERGFHLLDTLHDKVTKKRIPGNAVKNWKDSVPYYFKKDGVPFPLSSYAVFSINDPISDMRFITKYPSVGTWILLILIFCSFSFIAIASCEYTMRRIRSVLDRHKVTGLTARHYWLLVLGSVVILIGIALLWRKTFYDGTTVPGLMFMDRLSGCLNLLLAAGYIAGAFCLAGFLYSAGALGFIATNIRDIKNYQPEEPAETGEVPATPTPTPDQLAAEKKEETEKQVDIFLALQKHFNTYFILSAIILTLLVLCTGGLFSAINSLDFVRLLADDWGYSPARGDFVYLYGGLHTILLLLFYVPAKMRFSEFNIDPELLKKKAESAGTNDGKWFSFLKAPFSKLAETLVVVSPLLASLIQGLFDTLFK